MSRTVRLRWPTRCADCGATLNPGSLAAYYGPGHVYGRECHSPSAEATDVVQQATQVIDRIDRPQLIRIAAHASIACLARAALRHSDEIGIDPDTAISAITGSLDYLFDLFVELPADIKAEFQAVLERDLSTEEADS